MSTKYLVLSDAQWQGRGRPRRYNDARLAAMKEKKPAPKHSNLGSKRRRRGRVALRGDSRARRPSWSSSRLAGGTEEDGMDDREARRHT